MSERLGFNPEEESPEEGLELTRVLEICRSYNLPVEYMAELDVLGDVVEVIATASIWVQEEGHDLDEFLAKIDALSQSEELAED